MCRLALLIFACLQNKNLLDSDLDFILNGVRNLKDLNPDWVVEVSNDTEMDEYLRSHLKPDDWNLIHKRHVVEKTDLWRLLKVSWCVALATCSAHMLALARCTTKVDTIKTWTRVSTLHSKTVVSCLSIVCDAHCFSFFVFFLFSQFAAPPTTPCACGFPRTATSISRRTTC